MTRQEAFKGLKENICAMCAYGSQNMDTCDIRGCDNRDYIKALEQEPCDDAISRQEAIKQCGFGMTNLLIADCLRKLPPVTPQPKTGHWIANKAKNYPGWVHCSECGEDWTHDGRPPYCPACGARMRKEK